MEKKSVKWTWIAVVAAVVAAVTTLVILFNYKAKKKALCEYDDAFDYDLDECDCGCCDCGEVENEAIGDE